MFKRNFSTGCSALLLTQTLIFSGVVNADSEPSVSPANAIELQHTFRLDHMLDKVIFVVKRNYGSTAVILILPDGTKWFEDKHPDNVKWATGPTGDLIEITSPPNGPWQLIGDIADGSSLEKISSLDVNVEPLPQPLYQNEVIAINAHLVGDNKLVNIPGMDYIVNWNGKFSSQNTAGDDNLGAGPYIVNRYIDNGTEQDKKPSDGVFTSTMDLIYPWGDYEFELKASNAIFDRIFHQKFRLSKMPLTAEIVAPEQAGANNWQLKITVDDGEVKITDTYFQMSVMLPNGFSIPFNKQLDKDKSILIPIPEINNYGNYKVDGLVASTTYDGRQIKLKLPELYFSHEAPPPPQPSAEELAMIAKHKAEQQAAQEAKDQTDKAITIVIAVNIAILVLGLLFLGIRKFLKSRAAKKALATEAVNDEQTKTEAKQKQTEKNQIETDDAETKDDADADNDVDEKANVA